tara:strand:+ start:594 stop:1583 length:990 start_codon:yes stop_codon:yes gene_type:complete
MSEYLTKYFNAPTFSEATTVYDDDLLSTVSVDGYYSDGVVTRYQLTGVLGLNATCPTCVTYPCTSGVTIPTVDVARYDLKTTFGSAIGAIKLTVSNLGLYPIGIQLMKDNVEYDVKFSSTDTAFEALGQINAPVTFNLSFFSSGATAPCSAYNFSSLSLPTYMYNGTTWATDDVLSTVSLTNKRGATTEESLDTLILYVPKTSATDFTLRTIAVSPCGGAAQASPISIGCPIALPVVDISGPQPNQTAACLNSAIDQSLYVGYVSGSTVSGNVRINLNDFIFDDANGNVKASDSWYTINRENAVGGGVAGEKSIIEVQDGIVINIQSCV